MRRMGLALLVLGVAAVALPPLWYAVFPPPRPELPPAGRRVALADGVHVNVVERGAGPPVVLVHGLPGSAYDWRPTLDALAARGVRALAYDRVGYGWSDARPVPATLEANARELTQLLAAEALEDAVVVGWSYGGGTAIRAAQLDASRMARLVLVGSLGPGQERGRPPLLIRLLLTDLGLAWLRRVPPLTNGMRAAISAAAFSEGPQPAWWLPTLNANFAQPGTAAAWRDEGDELERIEAPDPADLALPILVVHGDDDWLVPVGIGRELARRAPQGRLVEVEGGSHMLPVTHAERLADAIVAGG